MKFSTLEKQLYFTKNIEVKKNVKHRPGPPVNPESAAQVAKSLGLDPGTYRNRLRRVAQGKISLEDAQKKSVMSRSEYSKLGNKAMRRNQKVASN